MVLTCTNLAFVNCIRILIILVIFFTHQVFKSTMLVLFYMSGSVGSLWFIFWIVFIFDTPSSHPRISSSEREFIESNTATIDKSVSCHTGAECANMLVQMCYILCVCMNTLLNPKTLLLLLIAHTNFNKFSDDYHNR